MLTTALDFFLHTKRNWKEKLDQQPILYNQCLWEIYIFPICDFTTLPKRKLYYDYDLFGINLNLLLINFSISFAKVLHRPTLLHKHQLENIRTMWPAYYTHPSSWDCVPVFLSTLSFPTHSHSYSWDQDITQWCYGEPEFK